MSGSTASRSGGRILADQLAIHGVTTVYGVPGESYLPVLDALVDVPVRFVGCRHEGGGSMMAEAHGKLTGAPGVCLVTRGPGATNAASGLHVAWQDGTPMILLIGQVARGDAEREAFQEVDYRRTFGRMAKWVAEIPSAARIPELLARAFATATSGRPGPVVLALPEDVLGEEAAVADAQPYVAAQAGPAPGEIAGFRELLAGADRPLVLVGGQPWTQAAADDLARWATASNVPVAAAWRCQDRIDHRSPAYAGHLGLAADPSLVARLTGCDVLVLLGTRLGDIETAGYELLPLPDPGKTIVHVHPSPEEIGRVFQARLPIVASGPRFVEALAAGGAVAGDHRREWF